MRSSCVCLAVASIILPTAASLPAAHKHRHRLRRVQTADAVVSSSDGSTMQPGAMPISQAPANNTPWFVASQDKGLWPENIATDGTLISLTVRPLQEAVRIESRAWYIGGKLEAEVQSASVTPGIVTSVYLATGLGKNSEGGDAKQDEIDFEWTGKYPSKVQTNVFVTGKGHSAFSNIGINTSAVPDRYGLEWNDTQLHFYLSGSLFRVIPLQHPLRPMQLYMSVWTTTGGWPGLIPWAGAMNWDSREGAPAAASFRILSFPVEYVQGVVENYAHPLSSDAAADSPTNTTAANSTATANATASANTTDTTTPSSNATATQVPVGDNSTASANATSAPSTASPSSNATNSATSTVTGNTAPDSNSTNTSTATTATRNAPTTTTATPSTPLTPPVAPATETDTPTPPPPTLTPPEPTPPLTPPTPSAPSDEPTAPALREKRVAGAAARGEDEGSYWSRLIMRARVVALARSWWG